MKKLISILLLLALLGGCATTTDTKYEIAFQVINAVDAYTTAQIRHTQGVEEENSITRSLIGKQPNETDVALLFI
ncbi:hypothetical protein LCGC14_2248410, partial [marine sediment metagenome]